MDKKRVERKKKEVYVLKKTGSLQGSCLELKSCEIKEELSENWADI